MNFAIVDDEDIQLQRIKALIAEELTSQQQNTTHRIDLFHSGKVFLEHWAPGAYDVVILDIFMGGINGVEVAKKIRQKDEDIRLVFCSRSNEFAAESYQVNAQYYLVKPATKGSIANMLTRLNLQHMELSKALSLPDGHTVIARDILYTEYYNHVVSIHLKGGNIYRLRSSHTQMEELLTPLGYFYSPNKGIIVNFHEVNSVTDDSFTMSDGQILPISRRKNKEIRSAYTKFCFQKMRKEAIT